MDDDRFRRPGMRYEHDEPVAFAVVSPDSQIDWSDAAHCPESTLWLPESLFDELATATLLGSIAKYSQTRLARDECRELSEQLSALESTAPDADVRMAAGLVRARARSVVESPREWTLLVEGP